MNPSLPSIVALRFVTVPLSVNPLVESTLKTYAPCHISEFIMIAGGLTTGVDPVKTYFGGHWNCGVVGFCVGLYHSFY